MISLNLCNLMNFDVIEVYFCLKIDSHEEDEVDLMRTLVFYDLMQTVRVLLSWKNYKTNFFPKIILKEKINAGHAIFWNLWNFFHENFVLVITIEIIFRFYHYFVLNLLKSDPNGFLNISSEKTFDISIVCSFFPLTFAFLWYL